MAPNRKMHEPHPTPAVVNANGKGEKKEKSKKLIRLDEFFECRIPSNYLIRPTIRPAELPDRSIGCFDFGCEECRIDHQCDENHDHWNGGEERKRKRAAELKRLSNFEFDRLQSTLGKFKWVNFKFRKGSKRRSIKMSLQFGKIYFQLENFESWNSLCNFFGTLLELC